MLDSFQRLIPDALHGFEMSQTRQLFHVKGVLLLLLLSLSLYGSLLCALRQIYVGENAERGLTHSTR